jgi:apolipoprotein D and lipocalin family protein
MTTQLLRFSGLLLVMLILAGCNDGAASGESTMKTVERVDLERYTGTWHEIMRLPNRFQRHCARGVSARYRLLDDGMIEVINSCVDKEGNKDVANGVARVTDTSSNAKLEVSFFSFLGRHWFWGKYWILDLDTDYQTVVVGHPSRKYGWILSRTATISDVRRQQLLDVLQQQGYDPAAFVSSAP